MSFPGRARSTVLFAILGSAAALPLSACDEHDVGRPCTARTVDEVPAEPVGGEHPVGENVSVQRDGDCESFQCLVHRGYGPYCTRNCSYKESTKKGACATNGECKRPLHCFEGACQDDDCPAGFECREVQETGPLAGQLFCVQKEGCTENYDCEALGDVECRTLACYDQTLRAQEGVTEHLLTCIDETELRSFCFCPEYPTNMPLTCQYPTCDPDTSDPWPENSVEVRRVCERK